MDAQNDQSQKSQEDTFDDILFAMIPIGIVITHYAGQRFYNSNPHAWFKIGIMLWYGITCWLTIGFLVLRVAEIELPMDFFVYFYNFAGQLIATTGIVDCAQLYVCYYEGKTFRNTNWRFLKSYVTASCCFALVFLGVFSFQIDLIYYRPMTLSIILTEALLYVKLIHMLWGKTYIQSIIYFFITFVSRIGIMVGVILRMTLPDASADQVGFVHSLAVTLTLGVVIFFVDEVTVFWDAPAEEEKDSTLELPETDAGSMPSIPSVPTSPEAEKTHAGSMPSIPSVPASPIE